MSSGVSAVTLAPRASQINWEHETNDQAGAVNSIQLKPIENVILDLSVALRIAKHAKDCTANHSVKGKLCGLQIGAVMEITTAFPLIEFRERERDGEAALISKIKNMLSNEKFDTNDVGDYVATSLCSKALVERSDMDRLLDSLFERQSKGNPAVLLVFDPITTGEFGRVSFSAFTLTKEFFNFMHEMKSKRKTDEELRNNYFSMFKVHEQGILREVPVQIRCSTLQKAMLHLVETEPVATSSSIVHSAVTESYMEELLSKAVMNCDQIKRVIHNGEIKSQVLLLSQLKRQTDELIRLCDSYLLHTGVVESL